MNKGRCFEALIEQDPSVVHGGPLVEQLFDEALGPGWICTSLIAAISLRGGVPQALHQDQGIAPESRHPLTVNLLTPITDVDERNGGTQLIPGSHRILADAARTDEPRTIKLNGMQVGWMRQQENWMLSVRPEVIERASTKLLRRMGFQAATYGQTNEGHGFGTQGRADEAAGALVDFRLAADRGEYTRVGELGPNSTPEELQAPYTLREVVSKARARGKSAPLGIGVSGP